ncbi:MAG TPA: HEAT repeat domain-containing protein [Edaphobacter sp.]|nr:HEAT repeat domain-containing protein [Edaphobacter sp.]
MTTTIRIALLSSTLLLVLTATQPLHAMAFSPDPAPAATAAKDDSAYAAGMQAMNEHRWQDAINSFDKVIAAKQSRADAALYWKAYSLQKMNRDPLALATCARLRADHSSSSWNKDCAVLSIDQRIVMNEAMKNMRADMTNAMKNMRISINPLIAVHPSISIPPMPTIEPFNGGTGDPSEDIKILALNSLLRQEPAKAIPLLRGILTGDQPIGMKKHAIFVLAQSKSPEAQSILHDAVTGKLDPKLQRQAIQMMAIFQGKRDNDTLAKIYHTTSDPEIKKSIIQAFSITHDAPHLVDLARSEKDLDLKRSIVAQLAVMHDKVATNYMMELLK